MLTKGSQVKYIDQAKQGSELGVVESDGVSETGLVVVKWQHPTDKGIAWTMLEDADTIQPA